MMQALPWINVPPIAAAQFEEIRLQTIFDCCKWDPQFGDVSILANFPLVLTQQAWQTLSDLAERLAAETIAAEQEILGRLDLLRRLKLPRTITSQWKSLRPTLTPHVRLIRFDFHYTTNGWRISEANTDTPSGFVEASCFTALMAQQYQKFSLTDDPTAKLAQAIRASVGEGAMVALIHATAYTDDRQVMVYIGQHLERNGLKTCLVSPAHLRWNDKGQITIETDWINTAVDFVVRFFPAEWLPNLPKATGWQHFFSDASYPACNPTTALIVQSKRFPLVWNAMQTPLPTWRALLPETRDPREISGPRDEWILKPAFGRAGEDIGIAGVTTPADFMQIQRQVQLHPDQWVAQRRFEPVPFDVAGRQWYPCVGVYTVNGKVVGAYGRSATQPITNGTARDTAVLLAT